MAPRVKPPISKTTILLSIQALERVRRQLYAAGEAAYQRGVDFEFAITGHKHYEEITAAIQELEGLKNAQRNKSTGV